MHYNNLYYYKFPNYVNSIDSFNKFMGRFFLLPTKVAYKYCICILTPHNVLPLSDSSSFFFSPRYTHVPTIFNTANNFNLFISLSHYKYRSFDLLPRGYLVADTRFCDVTSEVAPD